MSPTFRLFFDMDGVLVDFEGFMRRHGLTSGEVKKLPGAYLEMRPIAGALDGIRKVMSLAGMYGGEVWIATKPPTGVPHAYSDKAAWILRELPELRRRIIVTHDKGLLGGPEDYLVDDRPHRANCTSFRGTLLQFSAAHPLARPSAIVAHDWPSLVDKLHALMRARSGFYSGPLGKPFEEVDLNPDDPDGNLEDINAARDLLRLGPLRLGEQTVAPIVTQDRADTVPGFNTGRGFVKLPAGDAPKVPGWVTGTDGVSRPNPAAGAPRPPGYNPKG